jgi:hypothetical protein
MIPCSLAWKLGFHPMTLAHLDDIFTSFPKEVPLGPMYDNEGTHCDRLL